MKIKVYTHNDIDGVFSAILYGKLFVDNGNTKIDFRYKFINYDEKDWQDKDIREPDTTTVVLDYPYNPTANFWWDHHLSGLGKFAEAGVPGNFVPGAYSCAQVFFDTPGRDKFLDEGMVKKIVDEVNMIDYALYPTVDTVYDPTTFGPKMRMAFLENADDSFMTEIVRMFTQDRSLLYKLLDGHLPWSIDWRYNRCKVKIEEGYKKFVTVAKEEDGIVFYTDPPYVRTDRYFAFRWKPLAKYAVYIKDFSWMKRGCHIGVGHNPWNVSEKEHNIKEICEKFGGGGHFSVGGVHVETMDDALRIQNEIKELLKQERLKEGE